MRRSVSPSFLPSTRISCVSSNTLSSMTAPSPAATRRTFGYRINRLWPVGRLNTLTGVVSATASAASSGTFSCPSKNSTPRHQCMLKVDAIDCVHRISDSTQDDLDTRARSGQFRNALCAEQGAFGDAGNLNGLIVLRLTQSNGDLSRVLGQRDLCCVFGCDRHGHCVVLPRGSFVVEIGGICDGTNACRNHRYIEQQRQRHTLVAVH